MDASALQLQVDVLHFLRCHLHIPEMVQYLGHLQAPFPGSRLTDQLLQPLRQFHFIHLLSSPFSWDILNTGTVLRKSHFGTGGLTQHSTVIGSAGTLGTYYLMGTHELGH